MIIRTIRKFALWTIFMIAHNAVSFAQLNLVLNPSFEDTVSCPTAPAQINKALGWDTLIAGGGGSPELYNVCCAPTSDVGVPYNFSNFGFQYPNYGNGYIGIELVNSNVFRREYIQSKLQDKLKSGKTYCVKFFANLSNYSAAYIKPLGAYLDNGDVLTTSFFGLAYSNSSLMPVNPQVVNAILPLNDTLNWMKIEGSFIASGTEEYITIGNFFSDSNSEIGLIGSPTAWFAYYYIDDVSVIDASLPAYTGNDTLIHAGDSVFIGRQPEIGLDEDCIWFVNGLPIDTVAGLWVQPDTSTTYLVQQTICGNVKWDTVTVSVYGTGIGEATNGLARWLVVYPNPATSLLTIESPVAKATLSISNLLRQELIRQEVTEKLFSIDISKLGQGIYFVKLYSENGIVVKKFLKE